MGILFGFAVLLSAAHAALPPIPQTFQATQKAIDASKWGIPQSSGCEPEKLKNTYTYYHGRQSGTCGAMQKLWGEAERVLAEVAVARYELLDKLPPMAEDVCQTESRRRLNQSGLDSLVQVDARVQSEAARVMKICEQDRQKFEDAKKYYEGECAKTLHPLKPVDSSWVKKSIDKMLDDADVLKKRYEERIARYRAQFSLGLTSAETCNQGLDAPKATPKPSGKAKRK